MIMCGIFGIWHRDGSPVSFPFVQETAGLLRHRGPDDEGYLCFDTKTQRALPFAGQETDKRLFLPLLPKTNPGGFDFALGFRRLAILDTSPNGHQPMASHDGRYWVVLNGEIYNYLELRRELETLGHEFRSLSDTEVLLTAYLQWGPESIRRFIGMFAFAILDTRSRVLFLGRDPFGIKPLYYVWNENALAFASEAKALLDVPGVRRAVNADRLYLYLRYGLMDHGTETMFADVHQLPAAHSMTIRLGEPGASTATRYWQIETDKRLALSFEDAADRLRELFLASTRLHLRSDVAVGAALSGGIDSSSIVAAIRQVQGGNVALHTFSYLAEESALNEEAWVDIAGRAANAVVHKVRVTAKELSADVDRLMNMHGEPFLSTNVYAQYRVFRSAREAGIKVMLNGQGSDEYFGGYKVYLAARLASLLRHRRGADALRLVSIGMRGHHSRRLWLQAGRHLLPRSLHPLAQRVLWWSPRPLWLNTGWFEKQGAISDPLARPGSAEVLRDVLQQAITTTNLPVLLRYEDRNSMAHSIESRVPFLTPDLVTFVLALPEEFIIDGTGLSKAVLRRAMTGIVPEQILNRRDKIGFQVSEARWLADLHPWVEHTLQSPAAEGIPALNCTAIRRDWQAMLDGTKPYNLRIWRCVNLIRWAESFGVMMAA